MIVNADDFGFTRDVNEGIAEAHAKGILTATTLMANGTAFADAVRLAARYPELDIGCHLVLVGGDSLLPPYKPLPGSVPELLAAIATRRIRIYDELLEQVRRILKAGVAPTHLDTHKHTHLAPPVLDAVARLSREFDIRWVRRPFDLPLTAVRGEAPWLERTTSDGLRFIRARFMRVLTTHGCRTTDHFAGFQLTGRFRSQELATLFSALPEGLTEFMCHPGRCTSELRQAPTRLRASREEELAALTDPATREALRASGIALTRYRDL
ncbi:MAG: ChbG/HpnK family deacetylase [Bryobacterales bacterium]|nr:ChbG/HpnK family deacetylase [Bryobacterales bacterium]